MLTKVKLLLGITDNSKDSLLEFLIDNATEYILNATRREELNSSLNSMIPQLVAYDYNRLGTQGVSSENYSGLSFQYLSDYPENIMRQIRSQRKVGVI